MTKKFGPYFYCTSEPIIHELIINLSEHHSDTWQYFQIVHRLPKVPESFLSALIASSFGPLQVARELSEMLFIIFSTLFCTFIVFYNIISNFTVRDRLYCPTTHPRQNLETMLSIFARTNLAWIDFQSNHIWRKKTSKSCKQ